MERMLATRPTWRLERYSWYNPSQIGFRPQLGVEDGLQHFSDIILIGGFSHRIRSVLAMDMKKAYGNVSREAIVRMLEWIKLPSRVCAFVNSFLQERPFSIGLAGKATGHFTSCCGVPQGAVLAPVLFSITFLPMALSSARIPDVYYIIYADVITAWSVHPDIYIQETTLKRS